MGVSKMENYKVSMLYELLDLDRKITKLQYFLEHSKEPISKDKKELMQKQQSLMLDYMQILIERLTIELGE